MDDISVLYTSDLIDLLATIRYMASLDFLRISRVNLYNLYKIIDDCCTLSVSWIDIKFVGMSFWLHDSSESGKFGPENTITVVWPLSGIFV